MNYDPWQLKVPTDVDLDEIDRQNSLDGGGPWLPRWAGFGAHDLTSRIRELENELKVRQQIAKDLRNDQFEAAQFITQEELDHRLKTWDAYIALVAKEK